MSSGASSEQHHVHLVDAILDDHKDIRAFYQVNASISATSMVHIF
jgi:hypothetical protein